jgi:hypothetical protein
MGAGGKTEPGEATATRWTSEETAGATPSTVNAVVGALLHN